MDIKNKFNKILSEHKFEDRESIKHVEKLLNLKRNFVSSMPPEGSDVIHLVSGGIDSICTWAILMQNFKLKVHPVCIDTGQKRHSEELKSVYFFSNLFKKKYHKNYVDPFYLTFPMSFPEISKELRGDLSKNIHPQVLKKNYNKSTNTILLTRKYLFPALFPYPAALAALFFEYKRNIEIRTIFCSILPTDGVYNSSQTLTAIRAATLSLCLFTDDYRWQVLSVCFEKDLGLLFYKSDLIKWANKHQIPIEKTYTCLKGLEQHCGTCFTCRYRKNAFKEAKIVDKTIYLNMILNTENSKQEKNNGKFTSKLTKFIKKIPLNNKPLIAIKDYY